MNKAQLNDRIAAINSEIAITRAHASKLEGHLSEVSHWLLELEKEENTSVIDALPVNPDMAVMD